MSCQIPGVVCYTPSDRSFRAVVWYRRDRTVRSGRLSLARAFEWVQKRPMRTTNGHVRKGVITRNGELFLTQ